MLKTFLVEDEVVIREMIKKMIPWEQYGFELAGEAADGEMALPLILKSKPDLLITDIKMPFMDGLTLCKLVKKELPDIRIVPLLNPVTPPSIPYLACSTLLLLSASIQLSINAFVSFLPTIPPAWLAIASFCAVVLVLVAV